MSAGQASFCSDDARLGFERTRVMARASLATTRECARQFADRRWNCPSFLSAEHANKPLFGEAVTRLHTREAAFLHALMAASSTHETAQACSQGKLSSCGCSMPDQAELSALYPNTSSSSSGPSIHDVITASSQRPSSAVTSAMVTERSLAKHKRVRPRCGDNIEYGVRASREFHRTIEVEQSDSSSPRCTARFSRTLMDRHNEEAGRQIVKRNTKLRCRCLGISNSCSTQVCWKQLPVFTKVGNLLMSRYRNASLMKLDRHGTRLVVRHALSRQPSSTDLVYLGESPSFCSDNPGLDIVGTSGRECRVSQDHTPDSCDVLCCDRGYRTVTDHTTTSCNCRFVFCCRVRCDQCETVRRRHFCR
uniref:Protein Wnt n=1 Tax=Sycon ciliatum TaxID=27933 RepID=A0A077SQV8_9METZ|nr:Wnt Q SciWntQ [Sycon ciliatum]